jgi:hypothetical protein
LQKFGNWRPNESKSVGGQYHNDFTTPTWEEFSDEQRQYYKVTKRRCKEEI